MNSPNDTVKLAIDGGPSVRDAENFLVFGAPLFEEAEINAVVDCMRRGWVGTGPKVHQFESDFAAYSGQKNAVAVHSCTAALHLSLLALGMRQGDEVITTPLTFCATVNAIIHSGATPILADCDRKTMNIDPGEIEKKITARTRAILVVHFAGRPCDMDAIMSLAKCHGLPVIEDCAHAIETEFKGQKAGSFGKLGCFSFYVTKNITTGEGGMVITRSDRLAERIKIQALHGMSKDAWKRFSDKGYKHYEVIHRGFKYNMMDTQAVIGIEQLKRIEHYWHRRKNVWNYYNESFATLPCFLPAQPEPGTRHAYHLYTPLIDIDRLNKNRDWVLDAMTAENIGIGVHYRPIHLHPYYRKMFGWQQGDFPNAEWIGERTISLPISPALESADIEDICNAFTKILTS